MSSRVFQIVIGLYFLKNASMTEQIKLSLHENLGVSLLRRSLLISFKSTDLGVQIGRKIFTQLIAAAIKHSRT